jgi:hypothetical protein
MAARSSAGYLSFFIMVAVCTLCCLSKSTFSQQVSAPNGVAVGRDINNSPVTVNPNPSTLTCRHPSHGIERYQRSFPVTMTSPEMGGGHSQPEWCNSVIGTLSGQYPGGHFTISGSSESAKNHCPPFNCPQYTYVCTVNADADPVYKTAVGPECR